MVWEAVTAISVAVLAAMALVLGLLAAIWLRDLSRLLDRWDGLARALEREAPPLLAAARSVAEDTSRMVAGVRGEVEQLLATSRQLRGRVTRAAGAVEDRVRDLEAVLDLLQEEIEETALDVAATLRATRRGGALLGALKRAVGRRRRSR